MSCSITLHAIFRPAGTISRGHRLRAALLATGLLAPSGMVLLAFTYWPVLQAILASLTVRSFGAAPHSGLGNCARLFADPHFAQAAINNLVYAVGTIVPSLAVALGLALVLRESTRFVVMLRTLIALPMLIPVPRCVPAA